MGKRVMFFPSYLGGGSGHISRSLALANAFESRGWETAFVLGGRATQALRAEGRRVFNPLFPTRPASTSSSPAYALIHDASFQVLRDGFTHPWRAFAAALEALAFVRRFRPDVLVGDLSLLTWIVGRGANLPVVQLVRSLMHPAAPDLVWWEEPPPGAVAPDPAPVFSPLLRRWGLPPIHAATDLFRGDLYLVPGLPELDPLPPGTENTEYTGPLVREESGEGELPAFFNRPGETPVVYVTLGGGAGPVGSLRFFEVVNEAFSGAPWRAVVSTGRKFRLQDLPPHPENVSYHTWVPGVAAVRRSSAVVFHGGYGTLMEMVQAGVPGVVLPFHSEQEANGRRLAQNSAGCVLSPAADKTHLRLQRGRWRYGEYSLWVVPEPVLSASELRAAVESVLANDSFRSGAQALARSASRWGGAGRAVQLIEKRV